MGCPLFQSAQINWAAVPKSEKAQPLKKCFAHVHKHIYKPHFDELMEYGKLKSLNRHLI